MTDLENTRRGGGMIQLKPCDILLYVQEGKSLPAVLVRWAAGRYHHASLYIGGDFGQIPSSPGQPPIPLIAESAGRGARFTNLSAHTGRLVTVLRPQLNHSRTDKWAIIAQAIMLVSKPTSYYDFLTIARSFIPRLLWQRFPFLPINPYYVRDSMFICTELVAECFWRVCIDVLPENVCPMPKDFLDSKWLVKQGEGRIMQDVMP